MGWSFRRSKSFGLFKLNFSNSGLGFSFGVPGARVGVNAKGKKYLRGGIPGTGLYYQSSLPDGQPGQSSESASGVSPLAIIIMAFLVVGFIIFAISGSTPKAAPVTPVPQVVAPVAVPVAPTHAVKKHRRRHVAHRAPASAAKQDVVPASDSSQPMR
jgi:hypothetical protein